jgi:hypothetical protein
VRPGWGAAATIALTALACGLLAVRYGDRFWRGVIDALPWLG